MLMGAQIFHDIPQYSIILLLFMHWICALLELHCVILVRLKLHRLTKNFCSELNGQLSNLVCVVTCAQGFKYPVVATVLLEIAVGQG